MIIMYYDKELVIRPILENDLHRLWELVFKEEQPEWKKWDAPYYSHQTKSLEDFLKDRDSWIGDDSYWVVEVQGVVRGIISYYWEHKPSLWLEIGIVLHEAHSWGQGIGTRALKMWIDHLFNTLPLVRVGLTTWSGNERMIHVAEKLGMQLEAKIRKVRLYNDVYYDSIRMGILREEWLEYNKNS